MPYIPKFNKLSLQEMAYAPQLMRQQHDESVARNMEIAEALKFDYLNQDADVLEPKLQQYSQDVDNVAKDLASSGFSHDTKNKILGLRTKFSGDEQIRNIKKNYAQAMTGWEEQKKSLIAQKASGQQIANQKRAYFSKDAYKGAYDDDGFYQEFTPGMTSGVYDIAEDTKKAMTNLGKTGEVVGENGTSIRAIEADPLKGIPAHYRISTSTPGQYITTDNQIEAVAAYMKQQYDPSNTKSDRGLFSNIQGYDSDYVSGIIDNVGRSMSDNYYQQLNRNTESIQGVGSTGRSSGASTPQIATTGYAAFPSMGVENTSERKEQMDKLAIDRAKAAGLKGITSIDDLRKASTPLSPKENLKRTTKAYQEYIAANPDTFEGLTGREVYSKEAEIRKQIHSDLGMDKVQTATDVLKTISIEVGEEKATDVPMRSINNIAEASGKSINEANSVEKGITDNFKDYKTSFKGSTKKEQKAFDKMTEVDKVVDFAFDTRYGLAFKVRGEDKDGEPVDALVYLPETEKNKEIIFINYLSQLDPEYAVQYKKRHNIE